MDVYVRDVLFLYDLVIVDEHGSSRGRCSIELDLEVIDSMRPNQLFDITHLYCQVGTFKDTPLRPIEADFYQ